MPTYSDVFSGRSQYSLRYTVTPGTQEANNNRTSVAWSELIEETSEWGSWSNTAATWSASVDGSVGSGSKTYDFRNYNSLLLGSGSKWVSHNSDGTKTISYSASVGGGTTIGSASVSGSLGLTTIPRASTASWAASGTKYMGSTYQIDTNRASSSFTHTVEYFFGSKSGTIGTGVTTSINWAIPSTLLTEIPNSVSGSGKIRLKTYSGSTLIGTTDTTVTLTAPTSAVPTFSTVTHAEATAGVAANIGGYVKGISTLALAITGAAGVDGSTISSYKIEVAGQTINSANGTTTPINASGTVTIKGTVTDSRGRTATKTVDITVLNYEPPKFVVTPTVQRSLAGGTVNEEGTYLRVNINASVQSLVVGTEKNALRYRVSTRLKGTSSWTVKTDTTTTAITFNNYVNVGTYSITDAYDVLIEVIDDFATSTVIIQVPVAKIFMHWDGSDGVGIGKYRENGALDIVGDVYLTGTVNAGTSLTVPTIRATSTGDVGITSTNHAIQAGPDNDLNIAIDGNEIMARNNGAAGDLNIQVDGGNVNIGKTGGERVLIRPRIDNPFLAYAMAAGRSTVGTTFPVITLPAGRFTQAPMIVAQLYSGAGGDVGLTAMVTNTTTTQFQLRHSGTSGTRAINWIAVQMNASSAEG